jgi:hypothetical protein
VSAITKGIKGNAVRFAFLAAGLCLSLLTARAEARNFYVAPYGNNTDGTSLQTAWTELDQIKWNQIGPSDTIYLAGAAGPNTSITYHTTLTIPRTVSNLTITTFPYGGAVYLDGTNSSTGIGVNIEGQAQFVVIAGSYSTPLYIQNFKTAGVEASTACLAQIRLATIQNNKYGVCLYGQFVDRDYSPGPNGIQQNTFQVDNCILRDNDCSVIGTAEVVLQYDWFYNSQYPASGVKKSGARIAGGGAAQCVFGPGLYDGLVPVYTSQKPTIGAYQTLFVDATHANIDANELQNGPEQPASWQLPQFLISSCTSFMTPLNPAGNTHYCIAASGSEVVHVQDSVFYGGQVAAPAGSILSGNSNSGNANLQYAVTGNTTALAQTLTNPNFTTNVGAYPNNVSLAQLTSTDFSLGGNNPGSNVGSSPISSVASLVGQKRIPTP